MALWMAPLQKFIFWSGPSNSETEKKKKKQQNIEYLKNKKWFLEEIKTIFIIFEMLCFGKL